MLGLGGLTALFILIAPWVMRLFGYGGGAVGLLARPLPDRPLLGLSGIAVGILNSYEHFTVPAISPVFWNIAIILGLVLGVPRAHSEDRTALRLRLLDPDRDAAPALLAGALARNRDGKLQMVFDWRDPAVRRTFKLMLPITLGLGLINFNAFIDTIFAARLLDKYQAPSSINAAFRLYIFPQGMFSVAVATVLFPSLARLATRADFDGFRATVVRGLRQIAFLLIPASVVCAVLAEPIVRIVYQRGDFTPVADHVVAACLAAFSIGLAFNGAMLMLNRGFFSLQAAWIPTWVALGNLGLNAALDAAFYKLGIWGIPLATSVVNIAGTIALLVLLRRKLGSLDGRRTTEPCCGSARIGRARRRLLRRLASARRRARPSVHRPGRLAGLALAARRRRLPARLPAPRRRELPRTAPSASSASNPECPSHFPRLTITCSSSSGGSARSTSRRGGASPSRRRSRSAGPGSRAVGRRGSSRSSSTVGPSG